MIENKQFPTLTTSIRIGIDTLAILAQHASKAGVAHSRGRLMRKSLEDYAQALVAQGLVEPVESTEQALDVLQKLGYGAVDASVVTERQDMPSFGKQPTQAPARLKRPHLKLTAGDKARIEEVEAEMRRDKASATLD